jgi:ferredoxin
MILRKVYSIYFSPTGTTEKAVIACAGGMGLPFNKIDLTLLKDRQSFNHSFKKNELVIVGLPVYGGRLPGNLDDFFSGLKGNDTPAVALVMYGNREYDDALIELKIRLEGCGFNVIAGAAFIGEHTFSKNIATGRPNARDLEIAREFGRKTIKENSQTSSRKLTVKGNYPFVAKGFDPTQPGPLTANLNIITTEDCTQCGLCAENCPWGAIDENDFTVINSVKCYRCFRCIKNCPASAKVVKDAKFLAFLPQFEKMLNARRKEPELFLPN